MRRWKPSRIAFVCFAFSSLMTIALTKPVFADESIDLTHATLVLRRATAAPLVEHTAATVLAEEVELRSGVTWQTGTSWPAQGWAVAILSGKSAELYGRSIPDRTHIEKAEGYGIATDRSNPNRPILWIVGADPRG